MPYSNVVKAEADFTPNPEGHSFKITAPGLEGKNVTNVVIPSPLKFSGNLSYNKLGQLMPTTNKAETSYDSQMFQIIFSVKGVQVAVFQATLDAAPEFAPELVDCEWEQT